MYRLCQHIFLALLLFLYASGNARAEDQTEFLKRLDNISRHVQWHALHAPPSPAVGASAVSTYQSLSYLQGYNPAPGSKNVTYYNARLAYNGYNLFISAHAPEALLLDMNGRILHQWHFPCASIPNINKEFCPDYWVRARILDDGGLIAMVPYTGLIELDKNSNLIWSAPGIFHHDFDTAPNGAIYALSMEKKPLNDTSIIMNYISVYSASGKFIKRISLYELFKEYPDPSYLKKVRDAAESKEWSYAPYDQGDVFHANSIQIVTKEEASHSRVFKEGQLLLSVREMGLLMAVDPVSEKIVWLMDAGIWHKGQHSARLLNNGNILIFDNFYTRTLSRVIEFDPFSQKIIWDFQDPHDQFFSGLLGECYRLPNNNTLITESTNGHTFEVTPDKKIIWEFYNPYRAGKNNSLIAVTNQMQRIDRSTTLKWLK